MPEKSTKGRPVLSPREGRDMVTISFILPRTLRDAFAEKLRQQEKTKAIVLRRMVEIETYGKAQ